MRKSLPLINAGCYLASRWFIDKVVNKEKAPFHNSKTIITPNHSSLIDGVILAAYINKHRTRPLHFIVQEESFKNKFFHYILKSGRCIPVNRQSTKSINKMFMTALGYLNNNELIGIFPEGHINNGKTLRLPRSGAALLALESSAPVQPVGMRGFNKILTVGQKINLAERGQIYFGDIIDTCKMSKEYHQATQQRRMEIIDKLSTIIMEQIAELSGMQMHKRMHKS